MPSRIIRRFTRARNERFREGDPFPYVFERVVEAMHCGGPVSGEGFSVVLRRGRCVDDFVTLRRQRSERLTFDHWLQARDDRSEQRISALRLTLVSA
jgi:hypothetical protein